MKEFKHIDFDLKKARDELQEFRELLEGHTVLKEQSTILPFFKKRKHLSALFGLLNTYNCNYDLIAYELQLFGDFTCDLATGDSKEKAFCLIEFENAKGDSIFSSVSKRGRPIWGKRFEHGFSQIVDWLWKLDDLKNTVACRSIFGGDVIDYIAILVIGRNSFLSSVEKDRFQWRRQNITIGTSKIHCFTYDDICDTLSKKLKIIEYENNANLERAIGE